MHFYSHSPTLFSFSLALKIISFDFEFEKEKKRLEVEPEVRRLSSTSSQLLECGKHLDFLGF